MKIIATRNGYPVFLEERSVEEFLEEEPPELRAKARHNLSKAGGAISFFLSAEGLKAINSSKSASPEFKARMSKGGPGYVVAFCTDYFKGMSALEREAILYHELGHIVSGDLDTQKGVAVAGEMNFIDDVESELMADHHAASRVGAATMHSALVKMLSNTADMFCRLRLSHRDRLEEIRAALLGNPHSVRRLAALQSLMD